MRKNKLKLFILPLLLTSCAKVIRTSGSMVSSDQPSSISALSSSSVHSSIDFGSDPTSIYQREYAPFVSQIYKNPYKVSHFYPSGAHQLWGPQFSFSVEECWIDVELVGQRDMTAGVKGENSHIPEHAYHDYDNVPLDGRDFPGVSGYWPLSVYVCQEACQNPDECFIRVIYHATDNIKAITGYSLLVVYPFGDPVDATSEESGVRNAEQMGVTGPVWLDWKGEEVPGGVSFPKVEGLYQNIDINRVNAALDIMYENAKGRYFTKNS